jgi:hypothetical protein
MVDVNKIKHLLVSHFAWRPPTKTQIDPISGVVDVDGSIFLKAVEKVTKLPVQFGTVSVDFDVGGNHLESLEGCSTHVGGEFDCSWNKLTDLKGAPQTVGIHMFASGNPFSSLDGFPPDIKGGCMLHYDPELPLLRLLQCYKPLIVNAPKAVEQIINSHAGTGKRGMLAAGVELTRAGFKLNARW